MADRPSIGAFKADELLILEMVPNGGWVVSQGGLYGREPKRLGAYSTAQDMLRALSWALNVESDAQARADAAKVAALEAEVARLREVLTMDPTDDTLASVCLSYRHDFGLLDGDQRRTLIFTSREWWRATLKEVRARAALAAMEAGNG